MCCTYSPVNILKAVDITMHSTLVYTHINIIFFSQQFSSAL